jgi:hypothetical protein
MKLLWRLYCCFLLRLPLLLPSLSCCRWLFGSLAQAMLAHERVSEYGDYDP